tara:strand:- start:848 stop:1234 length:387 start_codon:yes stop_codon:yes gene_type:complete
MPRVNTKDGVKEFAYTPGGMAAARQTAAEGMAVPQGKDLASMGMGAIQGGLNAAGTAAAASGGNPYITAGAGLVGAATGALGADNTSKTNREIGKTGAAIGSAAEMLSSAFRKDPEKGTKPRKLKGEM